MDFGFVVCSFARATTNNGNDADDDSLVSDTNGICRQIYKPEDVANCYVDADVDVADGREHGCDCQDRWPAIAWARPCSSSRHPSTFRHHCHDF